MAKYTACICEGGAERAILDMLLDNHMLIFEREQLIEEEVLRCRSAKEFEEKYLKKGFKSSGTKPSIYCKSNLKYKNVKSYDFIQEYFGDIDKMRKALHEYKRVSKIHKGEKTLHDLLKSN